MVYRFETHDANRKLVTVTDFGAVYRGVQLDRAADIPIAATAAHVYTECARAAGLPDIILHGTATLACGAWLAGSPAWC